MIVLPALHPAFMLHGNRRFTGILQHDLRRAIKYARGARPVWGRSGYITFPKLETIRTVLRKMKGHRVAYDIETDGRHALICDVRCIGFYDGESAISIPLLFRDGTTKEIIKPGRKRPIKVPVWKPYYGEDTSTVLRIIRDLMEDPSTTFDTQNGQFDALCCKARLSIRARYNFDTMVTHHTVLPYLPHDLGFLASMYTEAPYYKANDEGAAWSSTDDLHLAIYNIDDCVVTWIAGGELRHEVAERADDVALDAIDMRYVRECQSWKEAGVRIDRDALAMLRAKYDAAQAKALEKMRAIAGEKAADVLREELVEQLQDSGLTEDEACDVSGYIGTDTSDIVSLFAPGSLPKLRKVLIALGVPLTHRTETGAWSTAADYLLETRRSLIEGGVPNTDTRVAFMDFLMAWREAQKVRSTFLNPEILADGRCHPTFSVHVVPSGRLAAKDPNFMAQPKEVRCIYVAAEGYKLVTGDWDSAELRMVAYLSGDPRMLQAFKDYDAGTGPKIHKVNCNAIFGTPLDADYDSLEIAPLYRAAKAVQFGVNYGAGEKTAFEAVRKEMPDLTFAKFQPVYAKFRQLYPRLFQWQREHIMETARRHYLETPILRRRIHFFEPVYGEGDSPEAAAMLNGPCQGGVADLVKLANIRILDEVVHPYQKKLRPGEHLWQFGQVHDELLFEVPERLAESFEKDFKRCAEKPPDAAHKHWHFPVDTKISDRWGKLPKVEAAPPSKPSKVTPSKPSKVTHAKRTLH